MRDALKRSISLSLLATALGFGCAIPTPHQNFKDKLQREVGKNVDIDPTLSMCSERHLAKGDIKTLPNGNAERQHFLRYRGICYFYCEFDPVNRSVVRVRYEGSEKVCGVPP